MLNETVDGRVNVLTAGVPVVIFAVTLEVFMPGDMTALLLIELDSPGARVAIVTFSVV
jgi:hypothetical protein